MGYRTNIHCRSQQTIQCIIPPYITDHMLEHKDPDIRRRARDLLTQSAEIRGHRAALAAFPAPPTLERVIGGKERLIYDGNKQSELPGRRVRAEGQRSTGDDAVDEAYEGMGDTYDFFRDRLERDSIDGQGRTLEATVHFRNQFNNAFWNGERIVFGDGDGRIFERFTKAVDIIGHELSHGLIAHAMPLRYESQSGALNESFADVFGVLVKQYRLRQPFHKANWTIGQDLLGKDLRKSASNLGIRTMDERVAYDDPILGVDPQPKKMSDYKETDEDHGGVHINSGIPNHAFYVTAFELRGFSWKTPARIWYESLLHLRPDATFVDMARVSVEVAAEFGEAKRVAVENAWEKVEVPTPPRSVRRSVRVESLDHDEDQFERIVDRLAERLVDRLAESLARKLAERPDSLSGAAPGKGAKKKSTSRKKNAK